MWRCRERFSARGHAKAEGDEQHPGGEGGDTEAWAKARVAKDAKAAKGKAHDPWAETEVRRLTGGQAHCWNGRAPAKSGKERG